MSATMTLEQMAAIATELPSQIADLRARVADLESHGIPDTMSDVNNFYINTQGLVENTETPAPLAMAGFYSMEKTELQAFVAPGAHAAEAFPFSAVESNYLQLPSQPAPGNVKISTTERPLAGEFIIDATGGGFYLTSRQTGGSAPWEPVKEQHADFFLIKAAAGSKITLAPLTMEGKPWNTLLGKAGVHWELWDPATNTNVAAGGFSERIAPAIAAVPASGEVVLILFPPEKWESKPWDPALTKPYTMMVMVAPNAGTFTKILLPKGFLYLVDVNVTISLSAATSASGALLARVEHLEQEPGNKSVNFIIEARQPWSVVRAAAEASKIRLSPQLSIFIPPEQFNPASSEPVKGRYLEVAAQAEAGLPGSATTYAWETVNINITQLATTQANIP